MWCRIIVMCGVVAAVANLKINEERVDDLKDRLKDIKNQLFENNTESGFDDEAYKQLILSIDSRGGNAGFFCGLCRLIGSQILTKRRLQKQTEEVLVNYAKKLCIDFKVQSKDVCNGVIDLNAPSIIYIIDNRPKLTAETICGVVLNEDCKSFSKDQELDFVVEIANKSSNEESLRVNSNVATDDITIVHITDIHVDLKYTKGASAVCDDIACCRKINEKMKKSESIAGSWGDYRSCDTPWQALVDALRQIKKQHSQIDAVYFTGDIVDHFMWDVSVDSMKNAIEMVHNLMRTELGDIPIYPILGNHDAQNIFPSTSSVNDTSLSIQWLYDHVTKLWGEQLPPDALDTVQQSGYYTTIIRPGLRLIALNNNVCYVFNWWILYEVTSIQTQFQWLHDVLLDAEAAGEKVHILAHVPNGEDYHKPCSREFRRIVDRFHGIISAQFHGHREYFGFNIFYENNNESLPINIAWDGGSLASYSRVNRNYVVNTIDPVNFHTKDVELWTYNLTEANLNEMENPIWYRQLSLREAFNLTDLMPSTLSRFVNEMLLNTTVNQQFWRMQIRDSDYMIKQGCNRLCWQELFCSMLVADNNDVERCQKIKRQVTRRGIKKVQL